MAADKAKVLASLNTYLKGKSHTNKFKTALAEKWAPKIKDDESIEEYVEDHAEVLEELGNEVDRRSADAVKKANKEAADKINPEKHEKEEVVEPVIDKDTPPWAKALIQQNKELSEKFNAIQAKETASSISERFHKDERLKGIDPKLLKGRVPTKEEDFEAFVTEAAEDLKDFVKPDANEQQQKPGFRIGADRPGFTGINHQQKPAPGATKASDAIKAVTAKVVANAKNVAGEKTQIIN